MADFRLHLLAGAATAAALGLTAGHAQAQDVQQPIQVDEIIVTAQLREQRAIEVPFALSAFSGEQLDALGIQEFDQLSAFTPGFLVQNQSPNNPGFVMRGITSDSGEATTEPRVSVFQDGVSISKSRGSYVELFDMERIEVAKGPQSTLYGRGALIGAVNLVQNRARPGQTSAEARIEAGSLGYVMADGSLNLSLGDTAGLRLSGRLKTRDGSVENLLGGEDYNAIETNALRLSGAWAPSDAMRFDLIANYQQDDASGTSFKSIAFDPADPATGAVLGGRAPWDGAALTPGAEFDGGKSLGLDREVWGVTGLARIDLSDALTLNSTTAYREFSSFETFDPDGVSLPIMMGGEDARGEQWSQEFRLNYDNGGAISAFVGAGWFREEGSQRFISQYDERIALAHLMARINPAVGSLLDGQPGVVGRNTLPLAAYPGVATTVLTGLLQSLLPAPARPMAPTLAAGMAGNLKSAHIEEYTNSSELTSYDLFGDVTFRPNDQWEFAAGLRWTRDDKTTGYSGRVVNGRSALGTLLALQEGLVPTDFILSPLGVPGVLVQPGYATRAGLPLFGLNPSAQPTINNGDFVYADHEDDGLTWRLTARYALSDDTNLYANYARGRRPEVLNASSPRTPFGAPEFKVVEAETVDSFEIGGKSVRMDGRLRLDGAVFYYAYDNFQTTQWNGAKLDTINAGEAQAYGLEAQFAFDVTPDFELFGAYGYNHSRFTTGARDGNSFRLSPDHMASVGAMWRVTAPGGQIEIQPTYTWQSKVFFDDDNDRIDLQAGNLVADLIVDEYQDSYGLLNLRVRYRPQSGAWAVEAFGDNILDEEYIKDAGNTGDNLAMPTFIAGRGATWGVGFTVRY